MESIADIGVDIGVNEVSTPTLIPTSDYQRLTRIIDQLMQRAETLIASIDEQTITAAPLNQRSSALNAIRATLDLLFKVQRQAQEAFEKSQNDPESANEQVIRIEYLYPDGSTHATPPWASPNAGKSARSEPQAVSGRSLWEAFWENTDGEDAPH